MSGLVMPGMLLRGRQRLVRWRWACPREGGCPCIAVGVAALIVQVARENPGWGYERVQGELPGLGYRAGVSTVRRVLKRLRMPPVPQRDRVTWRQFLHSPATTVLACGFFHAGGAVALRRRCVFFVRGAGARHVRVLGVSAHPGGARTVRQARNLLMGLGERAARFRFLAGDRAGWFTGAFGAVLSGAGIEAVKVPPRCPRANAYAGRWGRAVRAECTDRMLIAGPRRLRAVPGEYVAHCNRHRPHRARSLRPPDAGGGAAVLVTGLAAARIRRRCILGVLIREYERAA